MRLHLLPTAVAAVLVTTFAPAAAAKMSDRLAQRNVGTDDGAAPPGDYSGGDEYSGDELGWGPDSGDDVGDVAGGGDGGSFEEAGACFDTGDGEPVCVGPASPDDVVSLDTLTKYDLCTGCTLLSAVGCPIVGVLCWSADALTVGTLTIPCGIATAAACGGSAGGIATCAAICS